MIRFTNPWYLLLLPVVVAIVIVSWRHVHGMARGRKRLAFAIRLLLLTLLVTALAGPEAHMPNKGMCTMFVLDRSDSVSEADRHRSEKFIQDALSKLGQDDSAGVIAFGKNALIEDAPAGRRTTGKIISTIDGSATDIAAAIRLATASFPEGKGRRVVVLSDGNETSGDAAEAAQVASTDGIPIDYVPLGLEERQGEASVISLETPDEIRAKQPFQVRVTLDSTVEQTGLLDVDRDGVLVRKLPVQLHPGKNSVVLTESLDSTGFHRYRATLHAPKDLDPRNNVGMGFVTVRGKPKVLILQQSLAQNSLAVALRENGIDTDVVGPAGIPTKPEELQNYDVVLFNDINANGVTQTQMKLIQAAVRDSGVGFGMVGGENSFLPGGYYGTPIADMLPVDLNIRQRKTFPSTSICIMIDTSGSMGMIEDGVPKVRLAAKAAEETVKLMSPIDRAGVAGSTDGIVFVAPMQQLTNKGAVIEEIRKLSTGGGGIYVEPSMERGEEALDKESSQVRHMLLLADGNDCDTQEGSIAVALRMRSHKITTSTVAIGEGKDVRFLQQLAVAGGGRFYMAKRAGDLPAVMTQDTSIMSRSAIEEGAFLPKMMMGEEILRGIDGAPPLLAYCLTDSRPLARIGMKTAKDDPLLATWQYGLGTSLAFTSDAQPRWASRWVPWEGFGTFWSQAVRNVSRRATSNDYQVSVQHNGGRGLVEIKAFDRLGNPVSALNSTVRVATPSGDFRDVVLTQQAPGDYNGSFDATEIGSYIVSVAEPDPHGGQRVSSSGFSLPYPPEYRSFRANRPLLARLGLTTGGMELTTPVQALRRVKNPGASISELWPLLILLAALLLPVDVGVRRIALPVGEIAAKVLARIRASRAAKPVAQQVVVDRLQQAKQRAQRDVPAAASASERPAPQQERTPREIHAPSSKGNTAQALLEAKRRKKSDS